MRHILQNTEDMNRVSDATSTNTLHIHIPTVERGEWLFSTFGWLLRRTSTDFLSSTPGGVVGFLNGGSARAITISLRSVLAVVGVGVRFKLQS